jgi:hypothetical protein
MVSRCPPFITSCLCIHSACRHMCSSLLVPHHHSSLRIQPHHCTTTAAPSDPSTTNAPPQQLPLSPTPPPQLPQNPAAQLHLPWVMQAVPHPEVALPQVHCIQLCCARARARALFRSSCSLSLSVLALGLLCSRGEEGVACLQIHAVCARKGKHQFCVPFLSVLSLCLPCLREEEAACQPGQDPRYACTRYP